ncbi:MAG TPA: TonB-dependent receptor [Longimicrobiales bacterium]|nr:TonB-dependent receptor [Longimicrobiales bacterium]
MAAPLLALTLGLGLQAIPPAAVTGVIRDGDTGEPVADAELVLDDLQWRTLTDRDGRYTFAGVPPGPQHLTVVRLGYRARTLHLLVPRDGRLEIDVVLRASPIALGALLARPAPAVRGFDGAAGAPYAERSISSAALRNHPTLAQPDVLRALAGGEVVVDPESAAGVHIRGGGTDQTGYLLDGIPVLNPHHATGLFSAWNPDALAGVQIAAAAPSPAHPEALSGVIAASTRDPRSHHSVHGTLSTAEARVTVDGPLGLPGAGYLASWRHGFAGMFVPKDESSYLTGSTGDRLLKLQARVLGGTLRTLFYDTDDRIGAAAAVAESAPPDAPDGHRFAWRSRSLGMRWDREGSAWTTRTSAWLVRGDASARWQADDPASVESAQREAGAQVVVERRGSQAGTVLGVRLRRLETEYGLEAAEAPWQSEGAATLASAFAAHEVALGAFVHAWAGLAATRARGATQLTPRARLTWQPHARWTWTAAYSRSHQYTQSLRNPESVVGNIFPAELFAVAGAGGVPLPRSDQGVLAAEWRATAGVRLGVQAFTRAMEHLLLVAPASVEPFAAGSFATGSARARGTSLELVARGARYAIVASYGWQRVRVRHDAGEYEPRHGSTHLLEAGGLFFPTATSALRLGVSAAGGRRSTAVGGPFEWEACNLLDQGCEFAGAPRLVGPLGGSMLPRYLRLDAGARKHWHLHLGSRDVLLAAFGTVTNVLGHSNVLGYIVDPETGEREPIEMTPRSPLVVGVDVRL